MWGISHIYLLLFVFQHWRKTQISPIQPWWVQFVLFAEKINWPLQYANCLGKEVCNRKLFLHSSRFSSSLESFFCENLTMDWFIRLNFYLKTFFCDIDFSIFMIFNLKNVFLIMKKVCIPGVLVEICRFYS